jgi:hypothetical protein
MEIVLKLFIRIVDLLRHIPTTPKAVFHMFSSSKCNISTLTQEETQKTHFAHSIDASQASEYAIRNTSASTSTMHPCEKTKVIWSYPKCSIFLNLPREALTFPSTALSWSQVLQLRAEFAAWTCVFQRTTRAFIMDIFGSK